MSPAPVAAFLADVEALLRGGTATEHSYRPALKDLLDALLTPAVATNEPRRERFGAPDFLIEQGGTPLAHVEAKEPGSDLARWVADSERAAPRTREGQQLRRYRDALPNLLFTDGLEWHWFVGGAARLDQPLRLATWDARTRRLRAEPGADEALRELLARVAAQQAPTVRRPKELAERLARLAHWLRDVIGEALAAEPERGTLHAQLEAFRQTLLPTLDAADFADMYAQTIIYGLFTARVSEPDGSAFSRWDAARAIPETNPFLRKLFQTVAGYDLDPRIAWLVDDAARLLARADMGEVLRDFGRATRQEDPVVHFYETFLAAYDPRLRERRGVYYTPEPVVSYIVRSVDALLRTRFGKLDGLADPQTVILDPATGTATFLHAVVQHIHETLAAQGMAGAWGAYVRERLLPRLFGFELLMAPYTVAHLKLGLLLKEFGYQFEGGERLGIFLTNTLSDLPDAQRALPFAQYIADEARAATAVKRDRPVLVVLGNPPYSGHSANQGEWIDGLLRGRLPGSARVASYYEVDGKPLGERNPKWLQDDYVKFIRFAQWRIEQTGEGVLAFISNNGYLDNPTFRGMRQSLTASFDEIFLLNLHGSSRKKERAPDGSPDENVFDIQQGVAIGLFVKHPVGRIANPPHIRYADLWGSRAAKYEALAEQHIGSTQWQTLEPTAPLYLFSPQDANLREEYERGWKLTELYLVHSVGIVTARDHLTIAHSSQEAWTTVQKFAALPSEAARQEYELGEDVRDWKVHLAQADVIATGPVLGKVVPILYRPFDLRATYYTGKTRGFLCMPRADVMRHMIVGENAALVSARTNKSSLGDHFFLSFFLTEAKLGESTTQSYLFPIYLYPTSPLDPQAGVGPLGRRSNLSLKFTAEVAQTLGLRDLHDGKGDLTETFGPEDIFHYAYAVFHAPSYRSRYAEFFKLDFPRLPMTKDRTLFCTLARLGAQLVDLHGLRLPGQGGVGGAGGAAALANPGAEGVRFPEAGSNIVEAVRYVAPQGSDVGRVYLNRAQYVDGVEPETWAMRIGGYQPLEKWLKDRKGRALTFDDVQHYLRIVIALRHTRRLMAETDRAIPGWPLP